MIRRLTADELALWAKVTADIKPQRLQDQPMPVVAPTPPVVRAGSAPVPAPAPNAGNVAPPVALPVAPLPPRQRGRIARRDLVDARLDLHGLTEAQALEVLRAFIQRSVAAGHRVVLVITGKGRAGEGVLRRRLPDWLDRSDIRPYLAGFAAAGRGHGGDGAFYLALKRA